jgi:hypothetical protein
MQAIRTAFPEAVDKVFANPSNELPAMPTLDILPSRITKHNPLGPIPHDESTTSGNLAVLENIFRRQYQLPEHCFATRLFLVYGDQNTVERIRSCQVARRQSSQPYDSLRWIQPVSALFHLKMNYLYMLSGTHYGGIDGDFSTLYQAANFWERKRISKAKSNFFDLEELVIHSFQARITALVWQKLSRTGLGKYNHYKCSTVH